MDGKETTMLGISGNNGIDSFFRNLIVIAIARVTGGGEERHEVDTVILKV